MNDIRGGRVACYKDHIRVVSEFWRMTGPGSQQQTSDDAQAQLLPRANAWRSIPKELPPGPANDKEKQILGDRGAFFDCG